MNNAFWPKSPAASVAFSSSFKQEWDGPMTRRGDAVSSLLIMAEQSSAVQQKHVLVVDDNVELPQTCRELPQARDRRVSFASNGVRALKLLWNTEMDAFFDVTVERLRPYLPRPAGIISNQSLSARSKA
jgi:hypothetical protein